MLVCCCCVCFVLKTPSVFALTHSPICGNCQSKTKRFDDRLSLERARHEPKKKRGSFLKTWSANDNSDDMISVIFEVEEGFDIPLWIERVPTQSSPSDVLSREVVSVFEGAERVRVNSREIWKSLVK